MKKYIKNLIFLFLIILLAISIPIIFNILKVNNNISEITLDERKLDESKFKLEYESLNDVKNEDDTNKYIHISVISSNKMKYASFDEVTNLLKSGTGIIYFGFPECPWCRRTLPVFLNTISNYNVEKVLYFNALSLRDTKHLDENNNIITDKEADPKYIELITLLNDYLEEYNGLNDPTIKRLYFPTFVFVKNGKTLGIQTASINGYTSTKEDLNSAQKEELKNNFENYLNKIYDKICHDESDATNC